MTPLYYVQRCIKREGSKTYDKLHLGSHDRTFCNKDYDDMWMIVGHCIDNNRKITCPECIKQAKRDGLDWIVDYEETDNHK